MSSPAERSRIRPLTGTVGSPVPSPAQLPPPSREENGPTSVPTYSVGGAVDQSAWTTLSGESGSASVPTPDTGIQLPPALSVRYRCGVPNPATPTYAWVGSAGFTAMQVTYLPCRPLGPVSIH